ncbi:uncharacterized protein B0P05DRAFT_559033 [Gilbertella persicaria]|uniref:uncharacterized protein n=1 Tax=Gilbertella persicaria TaxID=101096 RepID=UPI00221F74A8|nr:uncharacterized protein B0P05DRAFT_559033 [Gilbertella persicaria]KAI8058909.1 hypothetical protein B0P05DRAFT_559033 [Gilbertella persicaria]
MYLPSEIIKEVGSYLTLADKGSCIRVCYDWYGLFLESLYTKVHVSTRHQFRLFYRTIQASAHIDDPLGIHVKELTFEYKDNPPVGLTRDEFESLPSLFQNLESLEFDPRLWHYMRYSDRFNAFKHIRHLPTFTRTSIFQPLITPSYDNHCWATQLTYLSLDGSVLEYLINNNLIISIWTRIPKLEELIIHGTNYTSLNVKMIMALGAQLPRLKHLTLGCVTLPLEETDMSSTTTFPLFTSAVSLRLDDVHLKNWRMITFLSLAFYHVESLDFDMTFDWFYNENVTIELYEQSMDACMGFAQLCIFLKRIRFRRISTSVFPFPYDTFFQEIEDIHAEKVKVEMTDYAWWSTIDPAASFKAVTTQTGLLAKANLKWSWSGKKTDTGLFKSLQYCPNLTELELECDVPLKHGLRLDLLLDHCQQLGTLCISNAFVTTYKKIEKSNERKYRLKNLRLKEAVLGDHLMDYIAQSCPNLDQLWINQCVQEKPRRSSFFVIRMPDHRFQSIQLNALYLNPGGSEQKAHVNMTILSFYESTRYTNQIERRRKADEEERKKKKDTVLPAPEMWRFYHVHKSNSTNEKHNKQLRRLSTEEAARIANFEMTDKKWKAVKNAPKRKQYIERQLWEKDIQFGAVLLLVKSVDKLEFNELKV